MAQQAAQYTDIHVGEIVKEVTREADSFHVKTNRAVYISRGVLLTTGADPRVLEVAGEKRFYGRGVSYCATCDGYFFKDAKKVIVVRYYPIFLQVRLERVFFRARPTVLKCARSTISRSTTAFASRRMVQRAWPAGGSEQASAISWAWPSPSKIGAIGGVQRFLRASTASSPASTSLTRTRVTMLRLVVRGASQIPSRPTSPRWPRTDRP